MLEFKKKNAIFVQMCDEVDGVFTVRWFIGGKWQTSYVCSMKSEAESHFYWLVLLCSNHLKYITES